MSLIQHPDQALQGPGLPERQVLQKSRRDPEEPKWNVICFYPADFTFVCPTGLEDLAEHYDEFKKLGVEVYSASTDTHFAHKAWHDTSDAIKEVKYPMLGDPTTQLF